MKFRKFILAFALVAMPAFCFAQADNAQLAKSLGDKIEVTSLEVKALKKQLKLEPANTQIATDIAAKEAEISQMRAQKKTLDKAVKTTKSAEKERKQAEKANKQYEKAAKEAESLKTGVNAGKSNEMLAAEMKAKADVLDAEVKTLKTKKKQNKNDVSIATELASKEAELKEVRRQKGIFEKAVKAKKTAQKEVKQANRAAEDQQEAAEKAAKMKQSM